MAGNWLGKENPWSLPAPPKWWLAKLAARDPELRILPGLKEPCYRVARRSAAMRSVTPILGNDSETGRMCREGVIPVVALRPDVKWNEDFFAWLDAHDTWAVGGPEKFANLLDQQDSEERKRIERAGDDEAEQRATSAYYAGLLRTGAMAFVKASIEEAGKMAGDYAPGFYDGGSALTDVVETVLPATGGNGGMTLPSSSAGQSGVPASSTGD